MNERTEGNVIAHKKCALFKIVEERFASVCSVEEFILEQENKNAAQKNKRDVRLPNWCLREMSKRQVRSSVHLSRVPPRTRSQTGHWTLHQKVLA